MSLGWCFAMSARGANAKQQIVRDCAGVEVTADAYSGAKPNPRLELFRQTIGAANVEVLNAHGALPAAEIAEQIKTGGRETGKRTVSHSLQALKKQGRVRIRGRNCMLPKARFL